MESMKDDAQELKKKGWTTAPLWSVISISVGFQLSYEMNDEFVLSVLDMQ